MDCARELGLLPPDMAVYRPVSGQQPLSVPQIEATAKLAGDPPRAKSDEGS